MVETPHNPQHRPGRLGRELRTSSGLGCGYRQRWRDCSLADGSASLCLDSQPLLEPRTSSLERLCKGRDSYASSRCRGQEGCTVHCPQHFPSGPLVSHLRASGNVRNNLSRNRRIAWSGNDHCRLEAGFQPDEGSSMDCFQILKPVPRYRLSRDGPRLPDSPTLEGESGPSNLFQDLSNDHPTVWIVVVRMPRVELDTVDWLRLVYNGLDLGGRRLRQVVKFVGNPGQFLTM